MITVVGSLNMDLVTQVERFPKKGETLQGTSFTTIFGGKGANQAVAASRLGSEVEMMGRVGDDPFGHSYLTYLKQQNVLLSNVEPVTHFPTGTAAITVSEDDNTIVIVGGANDAMTAEEVEKGKSVIERSSVLLVQLEISQKAVEKAIRLGKESGVIVILNPAPFQAFPSHWWELVDYVTPNEHEAAALRASADFHSDFEKKLIITEGAKGASYMINGNRELVKAPVVKVEDTTGAGDTFNGALASGLDQGLPLQDAISRAVAAASLSVTALGAQTGMPDKEELQTFIKGLSL
ncbi:ribokinase [Jeotgalibacillus proteolyticus]|uniref:Ribokinase n=1 Tax=Jeotgalibacillus proteolyticus TaxID=2082395 RepID=A0A2S5G8V3_9BACL|nr:ribokinase [Jeotgalibacillus proteolyticus]PPA69353.1 ribokinase [Jeotgalibacillus proteolyticus]